MGHLSGAVLVAALAASLVGCGGASEVPSAEPTPDEPKVDSLTEASCRHFRNVMDDVDVLSPDELRKKLKEVHDKGRYAEAAGVPEASRGMLAAATQDDGEAFLTAVGEMYSACDAAGV
jgi:hypothetical protein